MEPRKAMASSLSATSSSARSSFTADVPLAFPVAENPSITVVCQAMIQSGQNACVFLDENREIKGLLTVGDIVRQVIALGLNPSATSSSSVMKKDLLTIVEGTERHTLERRALEVMVRCNMQYIPVTDEAGKFIKVLDIFHVLLVVTGSKESLRTTPFRTNENAAPRSSRIPFASKIRAISSTFAVGLKGLRRGRVQDHTTFVRNARPIRVVDAVLTLQDIARIMRQENVPACLVAVNFNTSEQELHLVTERTLIQAVSIGPGMVARNGPTASGFLATLKIQGQQHEGPTNALSDTRIELPTLQPSVLRSKQIVKMMHPAQRLLVFQPSNGSNGKMAQTLRSPPRQSEEQQKYFILTCLDAAKNEWLRSHGSIEALSGKSRLLRRLSVSTNSMSATSASLLESMGKMSSRSLMKDLSFRKGAEDDAPMKRQKSNPHLIRLPSGRTTALPADMLSRAPSTRSKRQLSKAEECFAKGDYDGCLRNYTQYLERNPLDGTIFLKRAILLHNQLQNREEALLDFRNAVETHHLPEKERREALILWCTSLLEMYRFDEASKVWDDYNISSTEEIVAHGVLKFVATMAEDLTEQSLNALEPRREYEKALRLSATAVSMVDFLRAKRATIHNDENEMGSNNDCPRVQDEHATSSANQDTSMAYLIRSRTKLRLGMLDSALEDARKALTFVPDSSALREQYDACVRALDLQAKIVILSGEIEQEMLKPDNEIALGRAYLARARIAAAQGCFVRASKDFRAGLRSFNGDIHDDENDEQLRAIIPVLRAYGEDLNDILALYLKQRKFDKIRAIVELTDMEAVRTSAWRFLEERMQQHQTMGTELIATLQFEQALKEFSSAIEISQQFEHVCLRSKELCAQLYLCRAACLMAFKEFRCALQDCDAAIFLCPQGEKAWIRKCKCLASLEENDNLIKCTMEAKRRFGTHNAEIAELVAKAMAIVPDEAADTEPITSDTLFGLSNI